MSANLTAAQPLQSLKPSYRIDSIDLLRGLVMIIMALDHTRDFFHKYSWTDDPLNLATTTPILYFTRWITHLCAPTFVFLSGASAYFQSLRKTKKELSLFLIKRGLWLVFIEVFIITFAFSFDVHYSLIGLQVIWAIGISMIILGLVIWLPYPVIFILGALIVLGHNALDFYERNLKANPSWWYSMLHRPGIYKMWDHHFIFFFYPVLSWIGLMMIGYCFGKFILKYQEPKRKTMLLWLGVAAIMFFIVLRATNEYGDPGKWSTQKNAVFTFLSFMNVRKYPPSLLYMCATIGIAILFLAFAGKSKSRLAKFITVYGRVPFLYYVLHFFLIHIFSAIFYLARGHSFTEGLKPQGGIIPQFVAPEEGYSLFTVYAIWLFIVLSLYPVCKWFSEYKRTHKDWWLSYL